MQISEAQRIQTALQRITAARAANLDNLDATTSSRATQAQILSDAMPFAGAFIDAAISSRSSHGPNDIWTQATRTLTNPAVAADLGNMQVAISAGAGGRAALLDQITAARMAEFDAVNMPADVDTLLSRLTGPRAGYLDNLVGSQTAGAYSHPAGTLEQDAVVVSPTELTKHEKLCLDLSNLTQTTTVRTYVQVDGVNYRLADAAEYPTDFPAGVKVVILELTPGSRQMKVTLQSAVAEGVAKDVPYFYVVRSLA